MLQTDWAFEIITRWLPDPGTGQVILVTNAPEDSPLSAARLYSFAYRHQRWRPVFPPFPAVIGSHGFNAAKREGDGCSPLGCFPLQGAFGRYANPGTRLPYRWTTGNDWWVDDSASPWYNTWQTGPARGRWSSAEPLRGDDHSYDYAVIIGFNTRDRIPGNGSAIFLHGWEGPGRATLGCTALAEPQLLQLLRWLDPAQHPVLIQGPLPALLQSS